MLCTIKYVQRKLLYFVSGTLVRKLKLKFVGILFLVLGILFLVVEINLSKKMDLLKIIFTLLAIFFVKSECARIPRNSSPQEETLIHMRVIQNPTTRRTKPKKSLMCFGSITC